jgi:predicted transglutaminase-like cysteine proteinase
MGRQMGIFGHARALRAVLLAWGMACFGPVADVVAGTPDSIESAAPIGKSAEPFGLFTSTLAEGGLRDKWLGVERELDDEMLVLALCEEDRTNCVSPAALRFLAIVDSAKTRDGRARFGEINRAINLAIKPVSDLSQYGAIDVWSSPLNTFARGAGDCEDYAIAKFVALRLAGIPPEDVRLLILHDTLRNEDHAVVAVRLDGRWLTLDNRRMAMVEDAQVRNYRPIFLIDRDGVKRYQDAPLPALEDRDLASEATLNTASGFNADAGIN